MHNSRRGLKRVFTWQAKISAVSEVADNYGGIDPPGHVEPRLRPRKPSGMEG